MPDVAHALGLLFQSERSARSGDLHLAAEQAEMARDVLREIANGRSMRIVTANEADEARDRIMRRPMEHVSKPVARVLEQLAGKVED